MFAGARLPFLTAKVPMPVVRRTHWPRFVMPREPGHPAGRTPLSLSTVAMFA
ncbi:hypothetical protein B4098_2484 [Heyndrickxia coagulans]|uniref:Uncharacterized protein n=1 Tax=Heyndrickxia coagulans TaxID=1398 RepID=A0A150K9X9_HEYCO|nr:hypothetical protein B4098_2484 [Heyndrickxia coagulans]